MHPDNEGAIPVIFIMAPHCPAGPYLHALVEIHTVQFNGERGFSCAQCNAYLVYYVCNKQPVHGQGRSTYIFEMIVSHAYFAICLRENFSPSENILWYRLMFPLRSCG